MKLVSKLSKFISLQLYFLTSSQFVQHIFSKIPIYFSFWKFCPRRNIFGLIWNHMNTATSTVALDKKCWLFNVSLKFWKRHKQKSHGVKSLLYRACALMVNFSLFIVCAICWLQCSLSLQWYKKLFSFQILFCGYVKYT